MITHSRLVEIISYNPETGKFIWIKPRPKIRVGEEAGYIKKDQGRRCIEIDGRAYAASRLAFFYMTGDWPKGQIDHINCIRNDDRWENLRDCSQSQNQANRPVRRGKAIPLKGVGVKKHLPKPYIAQICKDGVYKHLGCFSTAEEAHEAYCQAAKEIHGEFWRG